MAYVGRYITRLDGEPSTDDPGFHIDAGDDTQAHLKAHDLGRLQRLNFRFGGGNGEAPTRGVAVFKDGVRLDSMKYSESLEEDDNA